MAENILDAVERLEQVIGRIERLMYGEPPGRPGGLIAEIEGLRRDVQGLQDDVRQLKVKRNNPWLWAGGYVVFVAAIFFGMVGVMNMAHPHNVLDIPAPLALWLAAVLATVAPLLLMAGFGWLGKV